MIWAPDHPRATATGYVREHVMIAEKALGKILPVACPVHHFDLNRANNNNTNLVICEDNDYHRLLHTRQRVVAFGGNPDTDKICLKCHKPLNREEYFYKNKSRGDGFDTVCKVCTTRFKRQVNGVCKWRDNSEVVELEKSNALAVTPEPLTSLDMK